MKGQNFLFSIGIDKYEGPKYHSLNNARHDVERLKEVLEWRYGFKSIRQPLYDEQATRENIIEALESLAYNITQDDNLIIHYAGHGDRHPQSLKGFWVPFDGQKISGCIMNSAIYDAIEAIPAKHILLISDSCYSGTFITRTRASHEALSIEELDALNSRWVFASCGEETAGDGYSGKGSPFGRSLCEFFHNNQTEIISAGEAFDAVIRTTSSRSNQTPQAAPIRQEGNQGGQMIFRLHYHRGSSTKVIDPQTPVEEDIFFEKPVFPLAETPPSKTSYIPRSVSYYEYQKNEIAYFFHPERGQTQLPEAIVAHKRLVLLGSAGSGKSVELLKLAIHLAENNQPSVPIYKRFNTYTGQDIESFLPDGWEKVIQENLVLLLDGLDEIQGQFFLIAIKKIIQYSNKYPKLKIVISCRTNFYDLPTKSFSGTLEGFSVYTLDDISLFAIKEYSTNNLQIDGKQFIEEIYQASYLDLVQKPYFFHLLSSYYLEHGSFPNNRSAVLEKALLSYFLQDKDHFQITGVSFHKKEIFQLLEKIAFIMEVMGKNFISEDELMELITTSEDFIKLKYLPTFKKQVGNNLWMFEHNNIQEYLASRVLAKKPFFKLIDTISLSSDGEQKVKPTWTNTLSFLVSIGDDILVEKILDWIVKNDVEVLVRFDPDRLSKSKRIDIFKNIFNFYAGRQIWLSSNKFTDEDLARFGYFTEVLEFLLEILENTTNSAVVKFNAIRILDKFHLSDFADYRIRVKKILLSLLDDLSLRAQDIYYVLGGLARLELTDKETVELIVSKFKNRKNQYIRAGLYKVLHKSDWVNEYINILLEGLNLNKVENPVEDREAVNLLSESHYLKLALQSINKPKPLNKLINYLSEEHYREFYLDDYKELISSISKQSSSLHQYDPTIYDSMLNLFVSSEKFYYQDIHPLLIPFFKVTKTDKTLFDYILKSKSITNYHRSELLISLVDKELIQWFAKSFLNGEYTFEEVSSVHQVLFWRKGKSYDFDEYLTLLEKSAESVNLLLERPSLKDWDEINKKRTQVSFNLIFQPAELLHEVRNIFLEIGKNHLTQQELFTYQTSEDRYLEDDFCISAVELLRDLVINGNLVTIADVEEFVNNSDHFLEYQIQEMYDYLTGSHNQFIQISEKQIQFIASWCTTKGNDWRKLWFFIHRFNIILEEDKILDLTLYYDFNAESKPEEPGTIEELEKFIPYSILRTRVTQNIEKGIKKSLSWMSNAGYALRKNIKNTFPLIIEHLESAADNEYKLNDFLDLWYKKTNNSKRLTNFIEKVHSEILLWKAIEILQKSNQESPFLKGYLNNIMLNEQQSLDSRFQAANVLMLMNDIRGLIFSSEYILDQKNPNFDFRHYLSRMPQLTNPDSLPALIKLLYLSKLKEFQNDKFNNLEALVLDTLYHIGIDSESNFIKIRQALKKFIEQNSDKLPNLNFLHFFITRIEGQVNMNKSKSLTIHEAITEWDRVF